MLVAVETPITSATLVHLKSFRNALNLIWTSVKIRKMKVALGEREKSTKEYKMAP